MTTAPDLLASLHAQLAVAHARLHQYERAELQDVIESAEELLAVNTDPTLAGTLEQRVQTARLALSDHDQTRPRRRHGRNKR